MNSNNEKLVLSRLGRRQTSISDELKTAIINKVSQGVPQTVVCQELGISTYKVRKIIKAEAERLEAIDNTETKPESQILPKKTVSFEGDAQVSGK